MLHLLSFLLIVIAFVIVVFVVWDSLIFHLDLAAAVVPQAHLSGCWEPCSEVRGWMILETGLQPTPPHALPRRASYLEVDGT